MLDDDTLLFEQIADFIRADLDSFAKAGQWLDAQEAVASQEAAERCRHLKDRMTRVIEGYTSARSEAAHLRQIEAEERNVRKPSFGDVIKVAARQLRDFPPDRQNQAAHIAERNARRILLVVWILTDTAPISALPRITKLQDWEWGDHAQEHLLLLPDGGLDFDQALESNRLLGKQSVLDLDKEWWVDMARDSLGILQRQARMARNPENETEQAKPIGAEDVSTEVIGWAGIGDIQSRFNIPTDKYDALEGRLKRFREGNAANGMAFVENDGRARNMPKYLYNLALIAPVVRDLGAAPDRAPDTRRTEKKMG